MTDQPPRLSVRHLLGAVLGGLAYAFDMVATWTTAEDVEIDVSNVQALDVDIKITNLNDSDAELILIRSLRVVCDQKCRSGLRKVSIVK